MDAPNTDILKNQISSIPGLSIPSTSDIQLVNTNIRDNRGFDDIMHILYGTNELNQESDCAHLVHPASIQELTTPTIKYKKTEEGRFSDVRLPISAEDTGKSNSDSFRLQFEVPDWGVEDYIADRTKWVKGVRSIGDEPGWFYFKVFFKFNTNYGLFGGMLEENASRLLASNSALRYLNTIKSFYSQEQIPMRINSLVKFTSILSKINTNYPWLIKGINGLADAMHTYTSDFSEERSLELVFNTESTDMKIINMLNLYKHACFDDINCKEIVPSNLRKFDMMVVIYHVPLKYFQTAIMTAPKKNLKTGMLAAAGARWAKAEDIINKTFNFLTTKSTYYKYKRMLPDAGNFSNMMSFQMFTFQNCEFDVSSFGNYFSNAEIKNEQAFQFEENVIKINYDRVFFHNMNEWNQMFYGSDGYWYDRKFLSGSGLDSRTLESIKSDTQNNFFEERLQSLKEAREGSYFFDKNASQYKSLIDYSESIIRDGLMSMDMKDYYGFIKGNIYGGYGRIDSEYWQNKMSLLKEGVGTGTIEKGNISGRSGYKEKRKKGESEKFVDSNYFTDKIHQLRYGSIKKGNISKKDLTVYGKDRMPTQYLSAKLKYLNGKYPIELLNNNEAMFNLFESLYNEAKSNERNASDDPNPWALIFKDYPEDLTLKIKENEVKKREIWNYMLSGTAKDSFLGAGLEAASNIYSFWKW